MSLFTLYAIERGATTISQIQDQKIDTGIQHLLESIDGGVDAQHVSIIEQKPVVTFTTTSIKAVLDMLPLLDADTIDDDALPTPIVLFFRQRGVGATFLGATSHVKMTINSGLIHWGNVKASHGSAATIDVTITVLGGAIVNHPITVESGQSIAGTTPALGGIWTVGPAYVNGVLIPQISDVSIDSGLQVETLAADGNVWPTVGFVPERRPLITFNTFSMQFADMFTNSLGGASVADNILGVTRTGVTRCFLRKRLGAAAVEADSTAVHIRFDVPAGHIHFEDASGGVGDNAKLAVKVTPVAAGGNAPIAVNTAVAIGVGA